MLLLLLALFSAPTHANGNPVRRLEIAPANGGYFNFDPTATERHGCVVSLSKPEYVRILSESETHFEVEWEKAPQGCYYQSWIKGQNLKRGFIQKSQLVWQQSTDEILPFVGRPAPQAPPAASVNPLDCLDAKEKRFLPENKTFSSISELIDYLKRQAAGMKTKAEVDQYIRCYPYGPKGADNYNKYKRFLDIAEDTFFLMDRAWPQEVNGSLMRCLIRRESGFDPATGPAAGLGQHTSVNIKSLSERLNKKGSWEAALWRKFFERLKQDPQAQALLKSCPGSSKNGEPVFNAKADALCPLQSMAASSIYNLQLQRELQRQAKTYSVRWENEVEYQMAIGAAYNIGQGSAGQAIKGLFVEGWVAAIRKTGHKNKEVNPHLDALRNCLQAGNKAPMYEKDKPVCKEYQR